MAEVKPEHMTATAESSQIMNTVRPIFPRFDVINVSGFDCDGLMAACALRPVPCQDLHSDVTPEFFRKSCFRHA